VKLRKSLFSPSSPALEISLPRVRAEMERLSDVYKSDIATGALPALMVQTLGKTPNPFPSLSVCPQLTLTVQTLGGGTATATAATASEAAAALAERNVFLFLGCGSGRIVLNDFSSKTTR
jgi:hypothetical protein